MLVHGAIGSIDGPIELCGMLDPMVIDVKHDLPELMPRQQLVSVHDLRRIFHLENSVLDERYNIIRDFPRVFCLSRGVIIVFHNFSFLDAHYLLVELVVEVFKLLGVLDA